MESEACFAKIDCWPRACDKLWGNTESKRFAAILY